MLKLSNTTATSIPSENNIQRKGIGFSSAHTSDVLDLTLLERMNEILNFGRITHRSEIIIGVKNSDIPIISKIMYSKKGNSSSIDWTKTKELLHNALKNESSGLTKDNLTQISLMLNYNFDRINNYVFSPEKQSNERNMAVNLPSNDEFTDANKETDGYDQYDQYDAEAIDVLQALKLNSGIVKIKGVISTQSEQFKLIKSYTSICICGKSNSSKSFEPPIFKLSASRTIGYCRNCNRNVSQEMEYVNAISIEIEDEQNLNGIQKISCILIDTNSRNARIGENVIVKGKIYVMPKNQRGNLVPIVYSSNGDIECQGRNEVVLTAEDERKIRRFAELKGESVIPHLVDMFDKTVIGMEEAKESLLYSLVSSGNDVDMIKTNRSSRNRLHTLLIGEPGNAKSSLLRKAVELISNSRFVSSQGSSGKSLTAIIEKENEYHVLRYGPLSLAREAVCALNEIGSMLEEDQDYLLDIMEEGRYTISKFAINPTIYAPTTIIASANFREYSNQESSDIENNRISLYQIPLRSPVIDRFDLKVVIRDDLEPEKLVEYTEEKIKLSTQPVIPNYDDFLRKYLEYARRVTPKLGENSMREVGNYYIKLKLIAPKIGSKRVFETITRISKSIAKLKLKEVVDENDVSDALRFYDKMIRSYSDIASSLNNDPLVEACQKCVDILRDLPSEAHLFEDVMHKACREDPLIRIFIEGDAKGFISNSKDIDKRLLKMDSNKRTRRVYQLVKMNKNIHVIKQRPATLQFIPNLQKSIISSPSVI